MLPLLMGSCVQVRITEAARDYTVVYDDTEESSVTEEEAEQRRSVVSRVKSLERKGARMQGEGEGQGRVARAQSEVPRHGLWGSNRDIIRSTTNIPSSYRYLAF